MRSFNLKYIVSQTSILLFILSALNINAQTEFVPGNGLLYRQFLKENSQDLGFSKPIRVTGEFNNAKDDWSTVKQQLDSVVYENTTYKLNFSDDGTFCLGNNFQRTESSNWQYYLSSVDSLTLDSKCRVTGHLSYYYSSDTQEFVPLAYEEMGFDDQDRLNHVEYRHYDPEDDIWIYFTNVYLFYNEYDQLTGQKAYTWNYETLEYVLNAKEESSFNTNGTIDTLKAYQLADDLITLELVEIAVYTYSDIYPLTITTFNTEYGSNELTLSRRDSMKYDDMNREICRNSYRWSSVENIFNPVSKNTTSYNELDSVTQTMSYDYNPETAQWDKKYKTESLFDDCFKTEEIHFYSIDGNEWTPVSREEWLYDSEFNDIDEIYTYEWDEANEEWINHQHKVLTHNTERDFSELMFPVFDDAEKEFYTHQLMRYELDDWDIELQEWNNIIDENYYYSEREFFGIPEAASQVAIYPNPVHDKLIIKHLAVSSEDLVFIYNLSGQLQLNTNMNSDGSIDVSGLKPGMYVVRVDNGDDLFLQKIVVQ